MTGRDLRFDGWIAGVGTSSGTRLVLGHWTSSPFGPFSDVMIEQPDGERLLLAPAPDIAEFVATTYVFDRVLVVPVTVTAEAATWTVEAGTLSLRFGIGGRSALGILLRAVPRPLAALPAWSALVNLTARLLPPGVRTRGTAGGGRRERYDARDHARLRNATALLDGQDLGALAPVDPPVRFGFGSVPRAPALVRVTTTVTVRGRRAPVPPGGRTPRAR
ncbi:hypothetical protein ACFYYR_05765 [Streptomyces sp. NPDC001922]|uniref:hypothetical protein n=1 Tax=Streptomyces sp. NPDC001922 TaxID=3364624 RepID=UPI0036AEC6C8